MKKEKNEKLDFIIIGVIVAGFLWTIYTAHLMLGL